MVLTGFLTALGGAAVLADLLVEGSASPLLSFAVAALLVDALPFLGEAAFVAWIGLGFFTPSYPHHALVYAYCVRVTARGRDIGSPRRPWRCSFPKAVRCASQRVSTRRILQNGNTDPSNTFTTCSCCYYNSHFRTNCPSPTLTSKASES